MLHRLLLEGCHPCQIDGIGGQQGGCQYLLWDRFWNQRPSSKVCNIGWWTGLLRLTFARLGSELVLDDRPNSSLRADKKLGHVERTLR